MFENEVQKSKRKKKFPVLQVKCSPLEEYKKKSEINDLEYTKLFSKVYFFFYSLTSYQYSRFEINKANRK